MASYKKPYSSQSDLSERSAARYKSQFATTQPATTGPKRGNPNWRPYKKVEMPEAGSLYKPILNPSDEQSAIFKQVVDGSDSLMVDAKAGTGKTSLCTNIMHEIQDKYPRMSQRYIIFAKRNQIEAVGKCPAKVAPTTAHSFGLQALSTVYGKIQVDKQKTNRIAMALVGPDDEKDELRYNMAHAIDLAKDYNVKSPDEVPAIMNKHGIELCDVGEAEFADKVMRGGLDMSAEQPNIVSFSDMIWLALRLGIKIPTYDLLYVDEAQDLNMSRIELVLRALGDNGRLIAVGDKNQAIFGFSGADRHALAKLQERSNASVLPLHKTFRCGKAIAELAKQYVPEYEAADTNPEGEVVESTIQTMLSNAGPGDFILSRTNAPTVRIAMRLLKEGRKCNIMGKDLGESLLYMIKRSKAKDVVSFQSWLTEWADAEIERLTAKNPRANVEHIVDKQGCLESFCEGRRNLDEVRSNISSMFDEAEKDETHRILLATAHKSKGLEAKRVYVLESSFAIRPKNEEEIEAERNIKYVSYTRAIESLNLVEGKV